MKKSGADDRLAEWFRSHKRELPWRKNRDPYRIWLSETMLQQTTTTAVIPYFERFIERFPTLETLAEAPESHVLSAWAGLGYYSRARNLHKAARALNERGGFPRTFSELLEYPGFGPYTARAVSSLAFGERVGVVDGNVIRVFARYYDKDWEWWNSKARQEIQSLADQWTVRESSSEINQGLMELGRLICTPKSPSCLQCPLRPDCRAFKSGTIALRPRPKPKKTTQMVWWRPSVEIRRGRIKLVRDPNLPFLKKEWVLPGRLMKIKTPPKRFDFRHGITHFDIYVTLESAPLKLDKLTTRWVPLQEITHHVPSSLVLKALHTRHHRVDGMLERPEGRIENPRRAQQRRRRNSSRRG